MVRAKRIRSKKLREHQYREGYFRSLEGKGVEWDGDNNVNNKTGNGGKCKKYAAQQELRGNEDEEEGFYGRRGRGQEKEVEGFGCACRTEVF